LLNNINKKASEIGELAHNAILLSKCVTNIIIYLIAIVVIVIFTRDELKIDFDKVKDNPKFYLLFSLTAIAFVGLAYGINQLNLLLPQEALNQQSLIEMFKSNLGIPIIILTLIFAPLIE
jgi:membrane protease YdiL (CAAX protease family)